MSKICVNKTWLYHQEDLGVRILLLWGRKTSFTALCGLQSFECSYILRQLSITKHRSHARRFGRFKLVLYVRSEKRLSQRGHRWGRSRQNTVHHTSRDISMEENAIRIVDCSRNFPEAYGLSNVWSKLRVCVNLPGWIDNNGLQFEQLVERFATALDRLRAANLKLNCRKCSLFRRKVS